MTETHILWNLLSVASLWHFIIPFGVGYFLKRNWLYFVPLLFVWELVENLSGWTFEVFGLFLFSAEPLANIGSDLIIGSVALYLGYRFHRYLIEKKLDENMDFSF